MKFFKTIEAITQLPKLATEIDKQAEVIPDATLAEGAPVTLDEWLLFLGQFKGLLIAVFTFAKILTSDTTDAKIDKLIATLNAIPVKP